jgi:ABC-2 type transport system permease protein
MLPNFLQKFAVILPTYHLKQLMLSVFNFEDAGKPAYHWLGLAIFTVVMLFAAGYAFNRREQNS